MNRLIIAVCVALAGCATSTTATPKSQVAAMESALTAAEGIADAYAKLPRCGAAAAVAVCSVQATVTQVAALDTAAYDAVTAAETVLAAGGSPDLAAAAAALTAFQTATTPLPQGN